MSCTLLEDRSMDGLFSRIKLARQEQTHTMKKERIEAAKVRLQFESLWGLVLMLLAREKQMHGDSMVQGRDGGSDCLKKQAREENTFPFNLFSISISNYTLRP